MNKEQSAVQAASGLKIHTGCLDRGAQRHLVEELVSRIEDAPLYTPAMPRTGRPFSVSMTNFGRLGWVSDRDGGYRYQSVHPRTGAPWPAIPELLINLWSDLCAGAQAPQACLVNYYVPGSRMGLHVDADEKARSAPVLSISLGDTALFRVGGPRREDATRSFKLSSGDVVVMAGASRAAYHGVDRIYPATSRLLEGYKDTFPVGGRVNLTLRRVD